MHKVMIVDDKANRRKLVEVNLLPKDIRCWWFLVETKQPDLVLSG
jgi:hypothetical protein